MPSSLQWHTSVTRHTLPQQPCVEVKHLLRCASYFLNHCFKQKHRYVGSNMISTCCPDSHLQTVKGMENLTTVQSPSSVAKGIGSNFMHDISWQRNLLLLILILIPYGKHFFSNFPFHQTKSTLVMVRFTAAWMLWTLPWIVLAVDWHGLHGPLNINTTFTSIGKAIPLQAWTDPEGSRRLRLPDFKTVSTWRW